MEPNSGSLGRRKSLEPSNSPTESTTPTEDESVPGEAVETNSQVSGDVPHEQQEYTPDSENQSAMSLTHRPKKPKRVSAQGPRSQNRDRVLSSLTERTTTTVKPQPPAAAATLELPVTKASLSELDVNKIVHNPKLRHDINFNPDLHFRPNTDGEKGKRKFQKANEFWDTLGNQLREYFTNRKEFEQQHGATEWALPAALTAIRGILETLVPERDRASVEETFNVDLLMQQISKGTPDLTRLAQWLSTLLKKHCAPMRDDWVDLMATQLSTGGSNADISFIIEGIKSLLGILEAMKLDVANHQIRCLREILIEDTVMFEQKFFAKKIVAGKLDVQRAHQWFKNAVNLLDLDSAIDTTMSKPQLWAFFKALVNFTLPSRSSEPVPHTFLFDEDRILKLCSDMLDAINMEICMQLYRDLRAESNRRNVSVSGEFVARPSTPVWQGNIDTDIMDSEPSSPESSVSSSHSTRGLPKTTHTSFAAPRKESSFELRNSLLDILASAPPNTNKWTSLSSDLALQIVRSTSAPLSELPAFENREAERAILSQLYSRLKMLVEAYMPLSNLLVSDAATSPRKANGIVSHIPVDVPADKEPIIDMATRVAHIGVLHWRVWGPLAYIDDPEGTSDMGDDEGESSDQTSNRQSAHLYDGFGPLSSSSVSAYI
ncbi:T-complex protein 11-domain-containing protein [Xylogone sp. PMI_703]|nr:T-complex protein 11-domain-containing protein [Xylogone sp. PMI_703]